MVLSDFLILMEIESGPRLVAAWLFPDDYTVVKWFSGVGLATAPAPEELRRDMVSNSSTKRCGLLFIFEMFNNYIKTMD
jgi:hypothetical protein